VEDSPHDENHALACHTKKGGIFKRNFRKTFKDEKTSSTSGYDQRKDMSKIRCFRCDKYGHFVRNCDTKNKGIQYASTTDINPDPPQKDEDMRNEDYFL
jgi:hypothetical protein